MVTFTFVYIIIIIRVLRGSYFVVVVADPAERDGLNEPRADG